ncbi:UBX domain-containing protein 10 [Escovopsis weberi]|uniref:UBX domain-containing protein 10 n=1 Tax=Escovopsis weberi TaxID=150374 RepID=A0A0M8N8P4_ESCWE|nr:UBX domain-containing protein 10 [Escovopsis weberi]
MADNPSDVGQLSASQQEALHQYMQVTNQDVKDSISLLRRSEWNAQIAITKFFDGEAPDPLAEALAAQEAPRPSARHENLQESLNSPAAQPLTGRRDRTDAAPRVVPLPPYIQRIPWILGLLLAPLGWGWHAASGLLRTISYILQFLPAPVRPRVVTTRLAGGLGSTTGRRMLMPRDAAARFKREFDEEYGPNELAFFEGGIAQAHDLVKRELKFLLVLLMSPEHDDTEGFVRGTLLAPEVVEFLNEPANRIVLWGGNVLDSEAYQAATEYACTKFPFSALVCLTPREGSTRMGIVKRLVGPMPAGTYLSELQNSLDKYGADLDGVRAERAAHEAARSIRSQQDSAYERSLAIDRARAQERREAAAAAAAAEKRALEEAERAERTAERRQQWRRWRTGRVEPEPAAGDKSAVRVALKMPEDSGAGRIVRRFRQDAPVEELYAFVECYDLLQGEPQEEEEEEEEKPADYEHEYGFRIVSILPRVVYEPSTTATMMETIGRSGNLIVEEVFSDSEDEREAAAA